MSENYNDMQINGAGTISGGRYNEVTINGAGKTNGDIICKSLGCNGAATLGGNVESKTIEVNGATSFKGNIKSDELVINGSVSVSGDLEAGYFENNGSCKVGGSVLSNKRIELNGTTTVKGNIKGENIEVNGSLEAINIEGEELMVEGGLNVETINVESLYVEVRRGNKWLSSKKTIGEIYGNKIAFKESNNRPLNFKLFGFEFNFGGDSTNIFEVDLIEGDTIYLENCNVKMVRGNNIIIGKNTDIDNVEYSGTLNIIDDGLVSNQTKL